MDTASTMTQKIVEIEKEDLDQFETLYPMRGSWTWFVRSALKNFLALHTHTPEELIKLGVEETIKNP
jgi:hypothetical protein